MVKAGQPDWRACPWLPLLQSGAVVVYELIYANYSKQCLAHRISYYYYFQLSHQDWAFEKAYFIRGLKKTSCTTCSSTLLKTSRKTCKFHFLIGSSRISICGLQSLEGQAVESEEFFFFPITVQGNLHPFFQYCKWISTLGGGRELLIALNQLMQRACFKAFILKAV